MYSCEFRSASHLRDFKQRHAFFVFVIGYFFAYILVEWSFQYECVMVLSNARVKYLNFRWRKSL